MNFCGDDFDKKLRAKNAFTGVEEAVKDELEILTNPVLQMEQVDRVLY
eukprot:gene4742-2345_t